MTLTLRVRNFATLDNGNPTEFVLHRRGAIIGRSPTCDWSLPDPRNYISSRHCEILFSGDHYEFVDKSTNGTFLNGCPDRMPPKWRIANGDVFLIGQYEVEAALSGEAAVAVEREAEASRAAGQSNWSGWDAQAAGVGAVVPPAQPASAGGWDAPPSASPAPSPGGWDAAPAATPASSGAGWAPATGPSLARPEAHRAHAQGFAAPSPAPGASAGGWAPAARAPDMPVASAWEAQIAPDQGASDWSSAAPDRPASASPDDIWGKIAEGNVVDWARGGFGQPAEAKRDPLGLDKPKAQAALPKVTPQMARLDNDDWGAAPAGRPSAPAPAVAPVAAPEVAAAPTARPAPPAAPAMEAFATAAGIDPAQLKDAPADTLERAGLLFRRLVAGLVVMVEARARAKSQMGAETTSLTFDGNNPIKFARTPEQAIAQLLNPPERGFMPSDRAIEDAYFDLQSHQMATLKAMQGALKATLDRFSPTAIRSRAEAKGLFQRIMPGARDAALWQVYEKEFGGVARGSDEAFMDVFAKEFRKAYEDQARGRK
ncbi:type VI secretion system-associated FHA domain protein TagH [Sphingomonas sp.]|uniref:type VI secretion system-associated FHA domain protein TagH n=1 Tax=Sphingomonas sp. TaxID=28214 RepID=UPI002DD69A24|nr:type VI secretion system-associated FHA domain protein TagH [Sphingomonas sp.]